MKSSFKIGNRPVGGTAPCLVIAEAGVSHFGDMGLARALVDMAIEAKADIFKTQFFDVDVMIAKRAPEWRDRLRPRNLTLDQFFELRDRCTAAGVAFMATAHDESRIEWLRELAVPAVKVGSGERNNPAFLTKLAQLGKPVILSTGMYSADDVRQALAALVNGGCSEVALLHCVTSYPAPSDQINLAAMQALADIAPVPVGYSDHTEDFLAVMAAVARGAKVIEKHITIRRDVPNAQDWKVSAGPENFSQFVRDIRRVESMIGHGRKEPAPVEIAGVAWATKSLVAARDLPAGHVIGSVDLVAKRPADGIRPDRISELLGKVLVRPVTADDPLQLSDVK